MISTSTPSRWAVDSAARACSTWKSLSSVISDTRKLSLFMAGTPQERRKQVKDTVNRVSARKRIAHSVQLGNLGWPFPRGDRNCAALEVPTRTQTRRPRSDSGAVSIEECANLSGVLNVMQRWKLCEH